MSKYKVRTKLLVTFDDGAQHYMTFPERVYYYQEQKRTYWVNWVENLIQEKGIIAKPIKIEEINAFEEVEEYTTIIGV